MKAINSRKNENAYLSLQNQFLKNRFSLLSNITTKTERGPSVVSEVPKVVDMQMHLELI